MTDYSRTTAAGVYFCESCERLYPECTCTYEQSRYRFRTHVYKTPMQLLAERILGLSATERAELYVLLEEH